MQIVIIMNEIKKPPKSPNKPKDPIVPKPAGKSSGMVALTHMKVPPKKNK